jgi:hypothetical protein
MAGQFDAVQRVAREIWRRLLVSQRSQDHFSQLAAEPAQWREHKDVSGHQERAAGGSGGPN